MRNRDLIALVDARSRKRKGKRLQAVVRPECRTWAGRHQDELRKALANPNGDTDLLASMTDQEKSALGLRRLNLRYGLTTWTHDAGDDHMHRLIVGLAQPTTQRGLTKPTIRLRRPGEWIITQHRTDDLSEPVLETN